MAKFCGKCGARLDVQTCLCPNCDREKLMVNVEEVVPPYEMKIMEVGYDVATETAKKSKLKAVMTLITILLSICFFCTSLLAIGILGVRNAAKSKNIEKMLERISFTEIVENNYDEDNLESFYAYINKSAGMEIGTYQINKFINNSTIKEFVADKLATFCADFFVEEGKLSINKYELIDFIKENANVLQNEFSIETFDFNIESIVDWILYDREIVLFDSATIKDNNPAFYYALRVGLSYVSIGFWIALSLLILYFLIKNNLSQAACSVGSSFIIFGTVIGLLFVISIWLPEVWNNVFENYTLNVFVKSYMQGNQIMGAILIGSGISILVIRKIVSIIWIRRKEKEASYM